jgi:hypothetical protein
LKRKTDAFFLSEISVSNFGSFSITRTFKMYCFIFPLLNELFEGKQSNDFAFKFESKCTHLHLIVEFLYNLPLGYFDVIDINSSYLIL